MSRSLLACGGALIGLAFVLWAESFAQEMGLGFDVPAWKYAALACGAITVWGAGGLWPAPQVQRVVAALSRVLAFLCLVLVLMQPVKSRSVSTKWKLLVLMDRSPSVAPEVEGEEGEFSWRRRLEQLSEELLDGDELVVVPFSGPSIGAPSTPDAGAEGADLSPILDMIPSMVSLDAMTTVLLLTDGGHSGAPLHEALDRLRRAGVKVLQGRLPSRLDQGDIAVTGIEVPPKISAGARIDVVAEVKLGEGVDARCALALDGADVSEQVADKGKVRFSRVKVGARPQQLTVQCLRRDGAPDAVPGNNIIRTYIAPENQPKVLVVDRNPGQAQVLEQALGAGFSVEVRGPGGVPRDLDEWREFDTVIVSDLPRVWNQRRNQFTPAQMSQVEQFVQEGGGLIMTGGPEALGPGGYAGTPLEQDTLPVWLDTPRVQEKPQLALVLVLDRSGSMSGVKLNLAKEAAAATVETLARDDRIGVVVFDAKPETVVSLQRASNRFRILDDIGHVGAGGGTNIRPALAEAFRMLRKNEARFRHVILLTDGQSPRDSILETVQSMTESGITVSTVAVGRQADRALLRNMAEAGSGRYHFTDSPRNIPRIFLSETRELRQQTADVERFQPRITRSGRRQRYLRKYGDGMGQLDGMVLVRPKPSGEVLMKGAKGNPLLVRGALGKGSVHVFTSDIKGIWTASWLRSKTYPQFWRGLLRSSLPTFDANPEVTLRDSGGELEVEVKYPMDRRVTDPPDVRVLGTDAQAHAEDNKVEMVPDAPGTFSGVIGGSNPGAFLVEMRANPENPRSPVVRQIISRPYDRELNPAVLASGRLHLDELHGNGLLPRANRDSLWSEDAPAKIQRIELWDETLIVFMVLWFLGLAVRRLPLGRPEPIAWL